MESGIKIVSANVSPESSCELAASSSQKLLPGKQSGATHGPFKTHRQANWYSTQTFQDSQASKLVQHTDLSRLTGKQLGTAHGPFKTHRQANWYSTRTFQDSQASKLVQHTDLDHIYPSLHGYHIFLMVASYHIYLFYFCIYSISDL